MNMLGFGLAIFVTAVCFFTLGRSYGWHIRDDLAWKENVETWRDARDRMLGRGAMDGEAK